MFSQDTYKGQGIQMPTGRSRAPEILAKGFSDLGAGIGKGIQSWKQNKAETKTTRAMLNSAADMEYAGAQDSEGFDPEAGAAAYETRKANIEGMSLAEMKGELDAQAMNRVTQAIKIQGEAHQASMETSRLNNRATEQGMRIEQGEHEIVQANNSAMQSIYAGLEAAGEGNSESLNGIVAQALADNPKANPQVVSKNAALLSDQPTVQEQIALDRLQWDKDKVAHDRAIEKGAKTINGFGWVTKTQKGREELSEKLGKHEEATILIEKLTSDSIGYFNSKWPTEDKARWRADVVLLKAALAKGLVGSGAISKDEWELIDEVIGNPTKATDFVGNAKAKLRELQDTLDQRRIIAIKAEVVGLTDEDDLSYSYGAKEKEKDDSWTILDVDSEGKTEAQLGSSTPVKTQSVWGL